MDEEKPRAEPSKPIVDAKLKATVLADLNKHGKDYVENVLNHFGVSSVQELTDEHCKQYIDHMEGKK